MPTFCGVYCHLMNLSLFLPEARVCGSIIAHDRVFGSIIAHDHEEPGYLCPPVMASVHTRGHPGALQHWSPHLVGFGCVSNGRRSQREQLSMALAFSEFSDRPLRPRPPPPHHRGMERAHEGVQRAGNSDPRRSSLL